MSFLITKSENYCKISEKNLTKIKFQVSLNFRPAWFEFPLLSKRLLLRLPLNSRELAFTRALNETRGEQVKKKYIYIEILAAIIYFYCLQPHTATTAC